jgi:DNA invertase Pin-like site-specific DNA recombinase
MAAPKIHPPAFSPQPGRARTAIYARVSTSNNGQDPTMQTRELEKYCQRRGWELAGCYVDNEISGSKESRPELDRLMADAHRRRFDAVAVWKFDRFARSVSHLLRALETFKALGIDFVSLSEQVDTSTPTGKMVFTVLGAVAQLERSLIAERVRAGLRNARAKGRKLGRPRIGVDASRIAALRTQGHSWGMCRDTGLGKGTAQRAFYSLPQVPTSLNRWVCRGGPLVSSRANLLGMMFVECRDGCHDQSPRIQAPTAL